MRRTTTTLIGAIATIHVLIAGLEMLVWEALGPLVFRSLSADLFAPTVALAANQGLYNLFLAAGLAWSLSIRDRMWRRNVATCFLIFVLVAGVFGAVTVSPTILAVQSIPAIAALLLLHFRPKPADAPPARP